MATATRWWLFVVDEPSSPYAPPGPTALPRGHVVQRPWYKKKRFLLPIGFVALLLFIGVLNGANAGTPTAGGAEGSSVETAGPAAEAAAAYGAQPADQVRLVEIVVAAQEGAAAADNDLQVGAIKAERDPAARRR